MRTIVAITGASGAAFGLELLGRLPGERFAILSRWGQHVLREETGMGREDVATRATRLFTDSDLSAPLASGSNDWEAMVVLPCSTSTVCGSTESPTRPPPTCGGPPGSASVTP